jgi:hypothetical protein
MELQGIEHKSNESAIAPIGGKLPYSLELQSSKVLDPTFRRLTQGTR